MEQNTASTVDSITELLEGDRVHVEGNGMDVATTVGDIGFSTFKGKMTATLEPVDGETYTLTDTDHPLQSDGITANCGAVNVYKA